MLLELLPSRTLIRHLTDTARGLPSADGQGCGELNFIPVNKYYEI